MPFEVGNFAAKNIIAHGNPPAAIAITVKAGVQYEAGQLMARKTADGLYEAHDNDGAGGLETCAGILAAHIDTRTANGGQDSVHMYVPGAGGLLIKSKLVAKDADSLADGLADLKMTEQPGRDIVAF